MCLSVFIYLYNLFVNYLEQRPSLVLCLYSAEHSGFLVRMRLLDATVFQILISSLYLLRQEGNWTVFLVKRIMKQSSLWERKGVRGNLYVLSSLPFKVVLLFAIYMLLCLKNHAGAGCPSLWALVLMLFKVVCLMRSYWWFVVGNWNQGPGHSLQDQTTKLAQLIQQPECLPSQL